MYRWLVLALLIAGCSMYRGDDVPRAPTGIIFGQVLLHDAETGRNRPVDRDCKVVVTTRHRTITTTTRAGAEYYMEIPDEGRWPLVVHYRGMELETEIGAYYAPNEINLVVEARDGLVRVRPVWITPDPERQRPPTREIRRR